MPDNPDTIAFKGTDAMTMWQTLPTLEQLTGHVRNTLIEHLGIEFLEIGEDHLTARMPVDDRTRQPAGLLHGGASAALAETLGSVAATFCIDREKRSIAGLELNANHIRPVRSGWVTGVTRAIHLGKSTQVWEIRIYNDFNKLVCIARLTIAVIAARTRSHRTGLLRDQHPDI